VISLYLSSCQKEISAENNGNPGGSASGDLLVKIVANEGGQTLVTTFEYDAAKRLTREKILGVSGGQAIDNDTRVIRDGSGIITTLIQKNAQLAAQGIDSVITKVNYNAGSQRYTSRVMEISLFGFTTVDSAALSYDASGNQVKEEHYLGSPLLGLPLELQLLNEFVRNPDGSMNENKIYYPDPLSGTLDQVASIKYAYDTKTSPLILTKNDAAGMGRPDLTALSNATQLDFTDLSNGAGSFTQTITYTYNNANKPETSVSVSGGVTTNSTYYYQ